jgi:predicted nucleic acid-binding protein
MGVIGRWVRVGREVAEDFVHVQHCAQAARTGLGPHPGQQFVEQDRDEEHALRVGPLDTTIAAHALSLGLTIVTDNEREFCRVTGLKVHNWAT